MTVSTLDLSPSMKYWRKTFAVPSSPSMLLMSIDVGLIVVYPQVHAVQYPDGGPSGDNIGLEIFFQSDVIVEIWVVYPVRSSRDGFGDIPFAGECMVEPSDDGLIIFSPSAPHEFSETDEILVRSLEEVSVKQAYFHVACVYHHVSGTFPEDLLVSLELLHASRFGHAPHDDQVGNGCSADQFMVDQGIFVDLVAVDAVHVDVPPFLAGYLHDRFLHVLSIHALDRYVDYPHSRPLWMIMPTQYIKCLCSLGTVIGRCIIPAIG